MLHTKFRGNRPAGSGEEDLEGILRYFGLAAILVMWPRYANKMSMPLPKEAPHKT